MTKYDLSSLEEMISGRSVSELNPEDFEFLRATLEKNSDFAISFENPLEAMFHIYEAQAKSGKIDRNIENFVLGAAGPIQQHGKRTRMAEGSQSTRKTQRSLFEGEDAFNPKSLPKELHSTVRKTFQAIRRLEQSESKTHAEVEGFSKELADAHAREVKLVLGEAKSRFLKVSLITDPEVRSERVDEIKTQIAEIVKRFREGQNLRLKLLKSGQQLDTAAEVDINFDFVPEGMDAKLIQQAQKERNLTTKVITGPLCAAFVDAYALLSMSFNTDELDSSKVVTEAFSDLKTGKLVNSSKKTLEQKGPEYMRYSFFSVVDKKTGETIGTIDGCFSASNQTNEFYMSHIATVPQQRRNHIATLLETAAITTCNVFANDAETALGAHYPKGSDGNKVNMILECEFASLRPTEVNDTFGRLLFHGRMGFSVVPAIRYRQSDTEWEEGTTYQNNAWNSVPMYLAIRPATGTANMGDAKEMLRMLYNGFLSFGMCQEGVRWDWSYALTDNSGKSFDPKKAREVPLPKTPEELRSFVASQGHIDTILPSQFSDSKYSIDKLGLSEKPLTLGDAMAQFQKGTQGPPKGI